jgi:phosphoenolpyruvate phosphomutase
VRALSPHGTRPAAGIERRTTRFKRLLASPELAFLIEAHNGISARIGEEAGFQGIWASGLCLSAQYGVRDSNEASWTQVLEMLEFMADATALPILLDGDTGYGNFNNVRRLVKKLEQRGLAAVCIEDKLFPKTNSFIRGDGQPLADVGEFCGKIRAGKDAQADDDFCLVARTEALIAGWGLGEALRRAEAYVEAGADAILVHSARSTAEEVLAFRREWGDRAPVVIVPTRYYATPTEVFREAGFSMVIWANHMLRAAVQAMRETARRLFEEESLRSIEDRVAPVGEIFRLQGAAELEEAEDRYLPKGARGTRAVVLGASRGAELGELTRDRPKVLIEVRGRPILAHIVETYRAAGIRDVTVVRGYRKEAFALPGLPTLEYVDNDEYETTGELRSLAWALRALPEDGRPLVVSYGDVLFGRFLLQALLEAEGDLVVAVDTSWRESTNVGRQADYVECSAPASRRSFSSEVLLRAVADDLPEERLHGEWTGFLRIGGAALPEVRRTVEELLADERHRRAQLAVLLNALVERGQRIHVVYVGGHWFDVDSLADAVGAGNL